MTEMDGKQKEMRILQAWIEINSRCRTRQLLVPEAVVSCMCRWHGPSLMRWPVLSFWLQQVPDDLDLDLTYVRAILNRSAVFGWVPLNA